MIAALSTIIERLDIRPHNKQALFRIITKLQHAEANDDDVDFDAQLIDFLETAAEAVG